MRNDSTTAVRPFLFGSSLLLLAWSLTSMCARRDRSDDGPPGRGRLLAAAVGGIALLILCLLAVVSLLILFLPALVHLVVE